MSFSSRFLRRFFSIFFLFHDVPLAVVYNSLFYETRLKKSLHSNKDSGNKEEGNRETRVSQRTGEQSSQSPQSPRRTVVSQPVSQSVSLYPAKPRQPYPGQALNRNCGGDGVVGVLQITATNTLECCFIHPCAGGP